MRRWRCVDAVVVGAALMATATVTSALSARGAGARRDAEGEGDVGGVVDDAADASRGANETAGNDATAALGWGCDETLRGWRDEGYRGCQTRTRNGRTCQQWDSQSPHGTRDETAARARAGAGTTTAEILTANPRSGATRRTETYAGSFAIRYLNRYIVWDVGVRTRRATPCAGADANTRHTR